MRPAIFIFIMFFYQNSIAHEQCMRLNFCERVKEILVAERNELKEENLILLNKIDRLSSKTHFSDLNSDKSIIVKKLHTLKMQYLTEKEIEHIDYVLDQNLTVDAKLLVVKKFGLSEDEFNAVRILLGQPIKHLSAIQLGQLKTLTINDEGLGGIKIGMTIEEASVVVGFDMSKTHYQYGGSECRSYGLYTGEYSHDGIRLLMINNIIDTIDIYDAGIKTAKGLSIGDSMVSVQKSYHGKYKIYNAYEWPENTISIKLKNGIYLGFTGPLFLKSQKENPAYKEGDENKIKENIGRISIGRGGGTVEGCL